MRSFVNDGQEGDGETAELRSAIWQTFAAYATAFMENVLQQEKRTDEEKEDDEDEQQRVVSLLLCYMPWFSVKCVRLWLFLCIF